MFTANSTVVHAPNPHTISLFLLQSIFWETPTLVGEAPSPRSGHTFSVIGEHFLVFGGCGRVDGKCSLDPVHHTLPNFVKAAESVDY